MIRHSGQSADRQDVDRGTLREAFARGLDKRKTPCELRDARRDNERIGDDQRDRTLLVSQCDSRFHGNFRSNAVRIADRRRDDRPSDARHSGSANKVSIRELSQTTIRSASFGVWPTRR